MKTLSICAALATLLSSTGPTAAPQEGSPADRLAELVPALARPLEEQGVLTGSLAVGLGGVVVYAASWGRASYELDVPNGRDTRFCVASLSKPVTALAVARLVATGELVLEDTVDTWIEGMPSGDEMTLLQLLRHQAGIPHRVTEPLEETQPVTAADVVERVKRTPLLFPPGTSTEYSTAGYSVVARILELVTGEDYDTAMRRLVFAPLGMDSTCHVTGRVVLPGRAQCYEHVPGGLANAPLADLSFLVGGGSLTSTAEDLVRFGLAAIARAGMPEGTWEVFTERLGWMGSDPTQWNGKTSQFGAFLDLYADRGLVVAFAGNAGVGGGAVLRDAVPRIVAGEDVPVPEPFEPILFTAETAAPFLGDYLRSDGTRTTVTLDRGYLVTSADLLFQIGAGRFFSPTYGCDVRFDRDADGAVTALVYVPVGMAPIVFERVGR